MNIAPILFIKHVLSTMGESKELISKFLIGNWFHIKLRILSPGKLQAKLTGEKLKGWSNSREKTNSRLQPKFRNTSS